MRTARSFLIFTMGLFAIASQTLLFREFITSFEGNDIAIGLFFGAWFLWVGIGAIGAQWVLHRYRQCTAFAPLLFLVYIPAFCLQWWLIIHIRELAGMESYALLSIRTMCIWGLLVTSPVSLVTGMLFPMVCAWSERDTDMPVSRVYVWEAAGSLAGGLGVTLCLAYGATAAQVLGLLLCLMGVTVTCLGIAQLRHSYGRRDVLLTALGVVLLVGTAGAWFLHVDDHCMQAVRRVKWWNLTQQGDVQGAIQTGQAEYLYGVYNDQWIVARDGSVIESLPDDASEGRLIAMALCQNPGIERVLVVGSGLGLCRRLLHLEHIQRVDWLPPDHTYARRIQSLVPASYRIHDERFFVPSEDVRTLLKQQRDVYDLIIVHLSDVTNAVVNRYYTAEFFALVHESLAYGGLMAIGAVPGSEGVISDEQAYLGGSVYRTLATAFTQVVLVPGEETWFLASALHYLEEHPGTLRDRFAAVAGAREVYAPEGLLSVYRPERAAQVLQRYQEVMARAVQPVNRDAHPLTYLYGLLLLSRESGYNVTSWVESFSRHRYVLVIWPLVLFVCLRLLFVRRFYRRRGQKDDPEQDTRVSGFLDYTLIFVSGWVSIGTVIVLMAAYQTYFGLLYLHVGIISALFMLGLTLGAAVSRVLLKRKTSPEDQPSYMPLWVWIVLVVHILILVTTPLWLTGSVRVDLPLRVLMAVALGLTGVCGGCYFPAVARSLSRGLRSYAQTGGRLEAADHLGACAGGLVTSLLAVPLLGMAGGLWVLSAGLGIILILALVSPRMGIRPVVNVDLHPALSALGYVAFGLVFYLVVYSHCFARIPVDVSFRAAMRALVGELEVKAVSVPVPGRDRQADYYEVYQENKLTGYVIASEDFAGPVRGFGGPMSLVVYVDTHGELLDFHILKHNETPQYLDWLQPWLASLKGHRLFGESTLDQVDAVTGATLTSRAVLTLLQRCGENFADQVLGNASEPGRSPLPMYSGSWDVRAKYLVLITLLALGIIYRGALWSRIGVLLLTLLVGGIWLNAQFSTEQIMRLLSGQIPAFNQMGLLLLVIGVPVLVLLWGNIYCGYLCPFGALQELVGFIIPPRIRPVCSRRAMQKARYIKYIILLVFMVAYFGFHNKRLHTIDPLIYSFNVSYMMFKVRSILDAGLLSSLFTGLFLLLGCLVFTRFWCRYLCPTGAFLSLLHHANLLRRFLPVKKYGQCEFGLTAVDNLDCIYCDRCRYGPAIPRVLSETLQVWGKVLLVMVVIIVFAMLHVSFRSTSQVMEETVPSSAQAVPTAGRPRDVDIQQIQRLIDQGKLSDHEALYYRTLDPNAK